VATKIKNDLFQRAAEKGFVDPVTGRRPSREVEFSSLLALHHQLRHIDWSQVPLLDLDKNTTYETADAAIPPDSVVAAEFPLFATKRQEISIWGSMPADLVFIAKDGQAVTLIENKVGGTFTYGKEPDTGQIGRQLDYLCSINADQPDYRRTYLLLTGSCWLDRGWYTTEVKEASVSKDRDKSVRCYIIRWEDVLAAFRN
jgi:hypothetical protein